MHASAAILSSRLNASMWRSFHCAASAPVKLETSCQLAERLMHGTAEGYDAFAEQKEQR